MLFIDEAYALYEGNRDNTWKGYGQEAIEVLVADIENFRKELLVIVAGYAKEIDYLRAEVRAIQKYLKLNHR